MKTLYHYTNEVRMSEIQVSGYIRRSTAFIEKQEKPAVWLSSNPVFENSASRCLLDELTNQPVNIPFEDSRLKAFRIEIDSSVNVITWAKYKHVGGIRPEMAKVVEQADVCNKANPNEWYACLKEIPREKWVKVECYSHDSGQWVQVVSISPTEWLPIDKTQIN